MYVPVPGLERDVGEVEPPVNTIAEMAEFSSRGEFPIPIFLSSWEELFDIQIDFLGV